MNSLTFRLTAGYAVLLTLTLVTLFFGARFYLEHSLLNGVDFLNRAEIEEIRLRLDNRSPDSGGEAAVARIRKHIELDAALFYFEVRDLTGRHLYKSPNLINNNLPTAVFESEKATVRDPSLGLLRSALFQTEDLQIVVASSLQNYDEVFNRFEKLSLLTACICLILSIGMGYILSRLALRPIRSIQMTAKQISASRLKKRLPVPATNDELADMTRLLNDMLERLDISYEQIQQFTADASHEFRTPLSVIRLQAERLRGQIPLENTEQQEAIGDILEGIERLNRLIDGLLLLAKADSGAMVVDKRPTPVLHFLENWAEDAQLLAEEAKVTFELQIQSLPHEWLFAAPLVRQVLFNLLSNALKFTPAGKRVVLMADCKAGVLALTLQDEGPGVPDDKIPHLFDRFARLQAHVDTQGTGLGLAICQSLINRHGGQLLAENNPSGGLRMQLRLPMD